MNRALARAIVRTLAVSKQAEDRLRALQSFSAADWRKTLYWLDDSALALYVFDAVERAGAGEVLPSAVHARLGRNLEDNRRRMAAMKEEFQLLNRHLDLAGAEYAVLKGFALGPDYCPDATLRSQYDYDYLVSPATMARAQSAIEALGFFRKVQSPGHEPEGVSLLAPPTATIGPDAGLYSASLARGVELHTKLWEYSAAGVDIEAPPDALDCRHPASRDDLNFPVLADVDALLFQVLHAFHHLLDHWCRLSCFLEIARFLEGRHCDAVFWESLRERVQRLRHVPEVTGLVFRMASILFDAPVPSEVSLWAKPSATASLWARHYGFDWALAAFPGSKLSLFVHRAFVDDADVWRAIRRRRLFPWHRPARVVETGDLESSTTGGVWEGRREHWEFVLGRARFHLRGVLDYAWHLPSWRRLTGQVRL
jgi:hypothetical protein